MNEGIVVALSSVVAAFAGSFATAWFLGRRKR
jgi:hypothetical protein